MKTIRTLVLLIVLIAAGGLAFIYSGLYDVAADTEHTSAVRWVLHETQSRSIHRRAEEVRPPAWMANPDPGVLRRGLIHYEEMCATCHGAPGIAISEIGQGLNPAPPELGRHADEPGESFWIIKHGIKMTGMPAFGVTHSDEEIWAITAFLQAMPKMTKEDYERMVDEVDATEPAEHEHAPGEEH
jgi:mono/diheme cytochrome c family protein